MPIKPENRALYPKEWPAISVQARQRARWRCQQPGCKALQYGVGRWIHCPGGEHEWRPVEGNHPAVTRQDRDFFRAGEGLNANGQRWTYKDARGFIARWAWEEDIQPIVIVLTVGHLNHDPTDCRPENLRSWCQRHHLQYDQAHHARTAYMTRMKNRNNMELPL